MMVSLNEATTVTVSHVVVHLLRVTEAFFHGVNDEEELLGVPLCERSDPVMCTQTKKSSKMMHAH
jgi:hypothetical protein